MLPSPARQCDQRPESLTGSGPRNGLRARLAMFSLCLHLTTGLSALAQSANLHSIAEDRSRAEQGDPEAQYQLGVAYDKGTGWTEPNHQEAILWYTLAARNGHSGAAFDLAYKYDLGIGVEENNEQAVYWYTLAAEAGDYVAQYNLALMYENGEGISKDLDAARRLYLESAEAGYASAYVGLGNLYDEGLGVARNATTAAEYYRKGAVLGDPLSQALFGAALALGTGVEVNSLDALAWLLLAKQGDDLELNESIDNLIVRLQADEDNLSLALDRALTFVHGSGFPSISGNDEWEAPSNILDEPGDELVRTVQVGLLQLGYFDGQVDGIFGPKTRSAILAFERDWEFEPTGQVSGELSMYIGAAIAFELAESLETDEPNYRPKDARSFGSGFFIDNEGLILTNSHVVSDCSQTTLDDGSPLSLIASEQSSDLALLRSTSSTNTQGMKLRAGQGIRLAEKILVAGYPLNGFVTSDVNVTTGSVSALSGPNQDRRLFQLTAPVQPGNSGGPVLDDAGRLVGVVVSKLDAIYVASETGSLPENVNFAVALGTVQSFLDAYNVKYETLSNSPTLDQRDVADIASNATVRINCF